jgi:hypothetical protein
MQDQSQATGTWRIGFDLAAFVLLATVSGMAAAVTLASIALLLSSVVPGTPATTSGAPAIRFTPANPSAPATPPRALPASPDQPAGASGGMPGVPVAPAAIPASPATAPGAPEAPADAPIVQTQLARVAAPAH